MNLVLAAALALASALAFAVSTVGQQRAAARTSDESARDGTFFLQLLRDRQWLMATVGNAAGYILQGAALGLGSVLLVQPILVTSLLFALPLGAYLARHRLPPAVIATGLVLAASLAVFEVLSNAGNGVSSGSVRSWIVVTVIGLPLTLGCLALARTRSGPARAGLLALVVGVLGGVLAVLTKSVVDAVADNGVLYLVSHGEIYGLLVVGLAGIYLQQLAFQAGELHTSLPIMTVAEPLTAALFGLTVLHEHVPPGQVRAAVLIGCATIAAAATIILARAQSQTLMTAGPAATPARDVGPVAPVATGTGR